MTVFEDWVVKTVKALMRDAREELGCDCIGEACKPECPDAKGWRDLEQRIAIGLVQARALECRQISGSVMVKQPKDLRELSFGLLARSSTLEGLGMELANQWPPAESVEPQKEEPAPGPRLVQ